MRRKNNPIEGSGTKPSSKFHSLRLFNWPRLTATEQEAALQLMLRALEPPPQVCLGTPRSLPMWDPPVMFVGL